MDLGLGKCRVLVTGSSRGIGYSIASAFLSEDAQVILTGRNAGTMESARLELGNTFGHDRVAAFVGDLGVQSIRTQLRDAQVSEGLDHLVCNVGSGKSAPPLRETAEEWRRMLDTNLLQAAGMVRDFLPLLASSAKSGHLPSVVFVGSICGMEAIGCPLAYASAKAALRALAKNLTRPLAASGVRVNMVSPGNVLFPGSTWAAKLEKDVEGVDAMLDREVPMRRLGSPEEIASAVVFLASRRASFITGANLVVDGGQTRGI